MKKSTSDSSANNLYKQLSAKLKIHDFNPLEVRPEIEKNIFIVPADKRCTSRDITEFEYARVLGERAKQIQNGSQIFIETDISMDEIMIAKEEMRLKCSPLTIRRMYNECYGEEWSVNEMNIPFLDN